MANRQRLYRGKRKDNGEWIEGSLIISGESCFISTGRVNVKGLVACDKLCFEIFEVIPETVCEWTGLEDKNGVKIFEDDYCLIMNPCVMAFGVIKYDNACYWFVENKVQADGVRNVIKLCDLEINDFEIQVKSNIHDNPELLEV